MRYPLNDPAAVGYVARTRPNPVVVFLTIILGKDSINPARWKHLQGLGSGTPVGTVVYGLRPAGESPLGKHGTTFAGNPVAMREGSRGSVSALAALLAGPSSRRAGPCLRTVQRAQRLDEV